MTTRENGTTGALASTSPRTSESTSRHTSYGSVANRELKHGVRRAVKDVFQKKNCPAESRTVIHSPEATFKKVGPSAYKMSASLSAIEFDGVDGLLDRFVEVWDDGGYEQGSESPVG